MKELLEILAANIVDNPDDIYVKQTVNGDVITLELHAAPEDMGKVIGKQGRIAKAIRNVVKAAAIHQNKRVLVEIV
ncbi:MAG: KH domain-containing protein [Clostridiales bacterium]|jgi:predicted RNA-binding protein YlqC (UPF0109 family)|nr:KH domain-containing protein [Clostridiales bacterium]